MTSYKPQSSNDMHQPVIMSDNTAAKNSRRKPRKFSYNSKRALPTALIVVALVVSVFAVVSFMDGRNHGKKAGTVKSPQQIVQGISNQFDQTATSPAGLKASENKLAELESKATSAADKEVYSLASANLYLQAKQLPKALAQAQKTETTYHTALSAATLAEVYRAQGDYANAAKYYGIASDRSPKTGPTERSAYNDYRLMKEDMESKQ